MYPDLFSKMWHHHTEMLMLGYGAYVVFFQFCKQAFPEISDQTAARMVAGIDVTMYRPDDELRGLARLAVEAGVDDLFTEGCSPASVLAALAGRGDGGRRWLAAFERARDPWFNVSTGDGFYHHHRSWADDLTVPFTAAEAAAAFGWRSGRTGRTRGSGSGWRGPRCRTRRCSSSAPGSGSSPGSGRTRR
jgi:pyruvate,water dikinase